MDTSPNPDQPDLNKGSGVRPPLAENRLLTRALRLGWPIPAEIKAQAVMRMGEILTKSKSTKAWVSAARVLVGMEHAEQSAVMTTLSVEQQTELRKRIEALEGRFDVYGVTPGATGQS
ncbi:MAG: hypothetical protein ACLP9L_02325 [Thermoguttaceae bacterium]